ncbi:MAG: NAD(P)-binding protein [Bacteroidales bacterium]|nr:NAD(P)-binding protein [Bacteroidales bacterium]
MGTGPAGLSAAFYLLKLGHECILFDKQEMAGGALRYSISDAELPREVLDAELDVLRQMGAIFILNNTQSFTKLKENGFGNFDAFILATGSQELHPVDEAISPETFHHHFINKETFETSIPGVFACGNIIREQKMAVRAGAQGKAAAINVDRYLNGLSALTENTAFNSSFGALRPEEYPEYLKESSYPGDQLAEGSGIMGFTAIEAMQEAKRCMHCDCRKPQSCLLRIHATQYGADKKHYSSGERENLSKSMQNEWIVFEPGKCIKCGLCIEITAREAEPLGLTFIGRGFDVKVKAPFNKDTGELMRRTALACAKACPTAAISEKLSEERHSQSEKPSNE